MRLVNELPTEERMEDSFVRYLRGTNHEVLRQVKIASGIIDILTPQAIYELKVRLTRQAMWQGIGQLLTYAKEITPRRRRLVLIGHHTIDTPRLAPSVARLGITVVSLGCHLEPEREDVLYDAGHRGIPKPAKTAVDHISLDLPFHEIYK